MSERAPYSLVQLARYFLKLGSIGFGGPIALVGYPGLRGSNPTMGNRVGAKLR